MRPKEEGKVTYTDDDGKEYFGHYRFDKGLLTVYYKDEHEKMFLHPALDPEGWTRIMLANIIKNKIKK